MKTYSHKIILWCVETRHAAKFLPTLAAPLWITLWITFTEPFTTLPKILHNTIVIKSKGGVSMLQMSVANAILVLSRKERGTMSKMKELFTEQTSIVFDVAECVECGVEIEFADENEFAKLVSEHACVRY